MTTYNLYLEHPNAGGNNVGYAAPTLSGLSINDATTGAGITKAALDEYRDSSTALIKLQKFLADLQRADQFGRRWSASSDGGATFVKPLL